MEITTIKPRILEGEISIPPSKSMSHRAIICGGLSQGSSMIGNILFSQDIMATYEGMKALGMEAAPIQGHKGHHTRTIKVIGHGMPKRIKHLIDCRESGSTLRFLIPLATLTNQEMVFLGKGKLSQRPLKPYYDIFQKQHIYYTIQGEGLPLKLQGQLQPGVFEIAGNISSQFITGLMFALPLLQGDSIIHITTPLESKAYVDLTLDILKKFSIDIENHQYKKFYIRGGQKYQPQNYLVEGDFSQAAFWMVAGILGKRVKSTHLNIHSLQGDRVIIDILREMGGKMMVQENAIETVKSHTQGRTIDVSQCPDLAPILIVLAALSRGTTKIINGGRLRIKESDRLRAMTTEINKLGGKVKEFSDSLLIEGRESLVGGQVDSWNDHRIAMALAIASIGCREPVIIHNSQVVEKSYPHFWEDFRKLGGEIYGSHMG